MSKSLCILFGALMFMNGLLIGAALEHKRLEDAQKGRLIVSMPLDPDDAAATMELLRQLVLKVKAEAAGKEAQG